MSGMNAETKEQREDQLGDKRAPQEMKMSTAECSQTSVLQQLPCFVSPLMKTKRRKSPSEPWKFVPESTNPWLQKSKAPWSKSHLMCSGALSIIWT
jgi:hypothetical protein